MVDGQPVSKIAFDKICDKFFEPSLERENHIAIILGLVEKMGETGELTETQAAETVEFILNIQANTN